MVAFIEIYILAEIPKISGMQSIKYVMCYNRAALVFNSNILFL